MAHRVKITFTSPTRVRHLHSDTLRLTCTASDGENMPEEIFLHQRGLVDVDTDLECDEFISICSPYDITTYPANNPDLDQVPAFFRKATIDILLPGVGAYDKVKTEIEAQVYELVRLLDKLDTLNEENEIWIPDAP